MIGSGGKSVDQSTSTSRVAYPQERKDLYHQASQKAPSPIFKRNVPAPHQGLGAQPAMAASTKAGLKENPAMSFIMLSDSQIVPPEQAPPNPEVLQSLTGSKETNASSQEENSNFSHALSHQIESMTRLFEILSSRSDIDHPVCAECTEILLSSLQSRLTASTKERDAYISFLKTLNHTSPSLSEISKAQTSLASTKAAEAKAFAELVALEKEKSNLDEQIANLEAESLALVDEEEEFWRSRNAFALTLSSYQTERDALNAAYDHDSQQLERLQRTNVYNDTFCISHDGSNFGTINGLRLGRLPEHTVDWVEINAAWGNAALLLATVADKLGFTFRGYRMKPLGSSSRIEKIEYPSPQHSTFKDTTSAPPQRQQPKVTALDLFSSGDLPLGRMLLHRRLDAGMVAFLECLRQLGEFAETGHDSQPSSLSPQHPPSPRSAGSRDPASPGVGLKLPYTLRKDKIGDVSIRLSVSQDEAWTRACKYTLTCCKFLLAHASNVSGAERRGAGGAARG